MFEKAFYNSADSIDNSETCLFVHAYFHASHTLKSCRVRSNYVVDFIICRS